jgi:hypothetical protein
MTARDVSVAARLRTLYLVRAGFAVVWVALVIRTGDGRNTLAGLLLVGYPLSDALASLVELRTRPDRLSAAAHRLNLVAAGGAAVGIGLSLASGFGRVVTVFGAWAITTGGVQAFVALRRGHSVHGQWFMLISGAGSMVAGLSFLQWAGPDSDGVHLLAQYSAGGAAWYVVASARLWLGLRWRPPSWALAGDTVRRAARARPGCPQDR